MSVERVVDGDCVVGEGPLWHPDHGVVYWLDIPRGRLFEYDPAADESGPVHEGDAAVGGYTIQADGSLLLFGAGGSIRRWRRGEGVVGTVRESIPRERDTRFNDVVADPRGRVFAGTMPTDDHLGALYRVDTDGSVTRVGEGFDVPNGMGFALDRSTMYLTVSGESTVYAYDYDQSTGDLSGRRPFVDVGDETGVPDGLVVDGADHVWSARWDGACVVRYTPEGVEERRVELPPPKASSLAFGGPDHRDAYVTTAVGEGEEADDHEAAGSLYRFRAPAAGVPEYRSRVGL